MTMEERFKKFELFHGTGRIFPLAFKVIHNQIGMLNLPAAERPTVRCAGCRAAARTGPHRWFRPRGVSAYRQDTRGEAVQQSVQASPRGSSLFGHTATTRDPTVCAAAAGVTTSDSGQAMRRSGPSRVSPGGVASVLAAHAARRSPQDGGHRSQRLPLGQAQAYGLTFFETQVRKRFLWHGNTLADYGLKCCTWS